MSDSHYIKHVLRMRRGELVKVSFANSEYFCNIGVLKNGSYHTVIQSKIKKVAETLPPLIAIIAIQKATNWKNTLCKLTELGVEQILFFRSERSIPTWVESDIEKKTTRWIQIINAALKQSHQDIIPKFLFVTNIYEYLQQNVRQQIRILCNEKLCKINTHVIKEDLSQSLRKDPTMNVSYIIGPEGGFTESEVAHFKKLNCREWKFNTATLKCDTASITAHILLANMTDKWR